MILSANSYQRHVQVKPHPLLDKSEELFNDAPSRAATPVVGSTTELKKNRLQPVLSCSPVHFMTGRAWPSLNISMARRLPIESFIPRRWEAGQRERKRVKGLMNG
jgi:hypothetical protein